MTGPLSVSITTLIIGIILLIIVIALIVMVGINYNKSMQLEKAFKEAISPKKTN